jgi:hypothetical protein
MDGILYVLLIKLLYLASYWTIMMDSYYAIRVVSSNPRVSANKFEFFSLP